jgi:hypothetical protein
MKMKFPFCVNCGREFDETNNKITIYIWGGATVESDTILGALFDANIFSIRKRKDGRFLFFGRYAAYITEEQVRKLADEIRELAE